MTVRSARNGRISELKGKDWQGHRQCHIGGGFLLAYKLTIDGGIFVDAGSHAELFG